MLFFEACKLSSLIIFHTFSRASKAHTGTYLAARIVECLHEYGIQQKVRRSYTTVIKSLTIPQILSLVCDNASNNDTMVKELEVLLPSFKGQRMHVRCFAHILNLVVKVFFIVFYSCTTYRSTVL